MASSEVQWALARIGAHQMQLPTLLFVAGHRPLSFLIGQLLHTVAPVAALAGWPGCAVWANLLSDPEHLAVLEEALKRDIERHT